MNSLVSLWDLVSANSLRASVLIACILLLRWLLRGRVPAQCFHLLWLLAGLRLLLPVAPSSATSVFNLLHASDARATDAQWVVRKEAVAPHNFALATTSATTAVPRRGRARLFSATAALPAVWLAGVLGQVLLLGWSARRQRRMLAEATLVDDPRLLGLARECAETLGLRRQVHLLETNAVAGPAVVGLLRQRLLLPRGLSARLTDEEMRFVLLHECAHLRRQDLAALWLLSVARVVHWFNPLVWLATRAARNDAELACDETVMRHSAEEARVPYGETLLRLTRLLAWRRSPLPLAGIVEGRGAMRIRLASIATYSAPSRSRSAFTALLVLGISVVFAVDEKPAPAASETPPAEDPVIAATQEKPRASETKKAQPQILIEAKFIETSDTAILRLKSRGIGFTALRAALRDGPDDNVLSAEAADEFHRVINAARGVDLISAPKVTTRSGQRAVIEIIREFRYPTDWDRDEEKKLWKPKAYETRNSGVTLEAEPLLGADGKITLKLIPQIVQFLGFRDRDSGKAFLSRGASSRLAQRHMFLKAPPHTGAYRTQPVFSARKRETTVTLAPGETVLLASLPETEDVQPFKSPAKGKRLIATISAQLVDTPATTAAAPVIGPDEHTIDLSLVPQVVEFEGFINYGSPIQTTSTNALGQTIVNVITPNVINQPIFKPSKTTTEVSLFDGQTVVLGGLRREDVPKVGDSPRGIVRASDNKPGFVRSPHAPERGLIDIRGFPAGTEIKCPYSGKVILVP